MLGDPAYYRRFGFHADPALRYPGVPAEYFQRLGFDGVEAAARWIVRVMISLLVFPGHDAADERLMLEQFVLPALARSGQALQ